MKRIHIVGCGPRCGTTLMTEMMVSCFDIGLYTQHEDSIYKIPPGWSDIYLTKNPQDILRVEPLLSICSELYVIYMFRDPRDMIVSIHGKADDRYWSSLAFWKSYSPFGRRLRHHPRFISVRYEDLVTEPDQIQELIMNRMPFLTKKSNFCQYHKASNPSDQSLYALGELRPPSRSSIGNWRKHLNRVAGQLTIHGSISSDLIEYGYEKNDRWLDVLHGVMPDLASSYHPERIPASKIRKARIMSYFMALKFLLAHYRFPRQFLIYLKKLKVELAGCWPK